MALWRVEALAVGEPWVLTHTGAAKPIIWLGQRHIDCTQHPETDAGLAGAQRLPGRRVRTAAAERRSLSVAGTLHLLQQRSDPGEASHQWLDDRAGSVPRSNVLPPGAAAPRRCDLGGTAGQDRILDTDGRTNFANGGGVIRLFPDFASLGDDTALLWEAIGFAPRHVVGPAVEAARSLLMARAKRLAAPARRSHRKVAG